MIITIFKLQAHLAQNLQISPVIDTTNINLFFSVTTQILKMYK